MKDFAGGGVATQISANDFGSNSIGGIRRLLAWILAAASRTFCTAGTSRPINMAIMAITTRS